jgi:hypothetical protein
LSDQKQDEDQNKDVDMRGIYRDHHHRLRASPETFPVVLADFLETDVSDHSGWCEELLAGLERARRGESFVATGNIYKLSADPMMVQIRNGYDEALEPLRLPLRDLERALTAWRRAIE